MARTLIIVITRCYVPKEWHSDEFIHDWNVTEAQRDEPGVLFDLTDAGDKLLLVHGHDKYEKPESWQNAIEAAAAGRLDLKDWRDQNVILLTHGRDNTPGTLKLGRHTIRSEAYSGKGGAPTLAVAETLRRRKVGEELRKAVEDRCLNSIPLQQTNLIHVRESLLAIHFLLRAANNASASQEDKKDAVASLVHLRAAIEKHVGAPSVQKLKGRMSSPLSDEWKIFVIGDPPEISMGMRGVFSDFAHQWESVGFWTQYIQSSGASPFDRVASFDVEKVIADLRSISRGVSALLGGL